MPDGLISTVASNFVSKIFKKPQTKDGFAKFVQVYTQAIQEKGIGQYPAFVPKFMRGEAMTLKEKKECTAWVLNRTRNWTKAQKSNLQDALAKIRIISEPVKAPIEIHTLSASFNKTLLEQGIQTSSDPQELVTPPQIKVKMDTKKILFYGGLGILLLICLRMFRR